MIRGWHDDHHVGADAVRPLSTGRLPIREVADLDQHRHARLIDVERQRLLLDLDVAHVDLRQVHAFDRRRRQHVVDPFVLDPGRYKVEIIVRDVPKEAIAGVLERDSLSEEAIVTLAVPQSSPQVPSVPRS